MKLAIQRHGIVIRTIDLRGDTARIGSGPECEVMLDDPYLAAHVADFVKRPDGWYVVDTAASLEGVSRDGVRIEEEKVAAGATYSVGGFEIVPQLGPEVSAPAAQAAAPQFDSVLPRTMMETELPPRSPAQAREIPKTMMEAELPPEIRGDVAPQARAETPRNVVRSTPAAAPKAPGLEGFQRVDTRPGTAAAPAVAGSAPKKSKALLFVAAGLGALIVLVAIIGIVAGGKKTEPAKPTETATAATPKPAEPVPTPAVPASADQLLAKLDADKALAAWEATLASAPDPATQDRYAALALELAQLHSAANDTAKANAYFERVVKFGRPDSDAVKTAKKRLGR
ncbi:MAG: FHA domain-containing protein [Thermoanaerobaculia bacterium]